MTVEEIDAVLLKFRAEEIRKIPTIFVFSFFSPNLIKPNLLGL